ncbi:MAG TPA: acyl-CoA thioesterase [Saprospiraceae bacterium]|nr:acyl-CoA thioesterase [Saprospiraceae bacterium]
MINQPETRTRIRFKDCDPLGHLYNTRYIEYMLEAREDQLEEYYQLNLMDYALKQHMAWVIVKHEIAYLREATRNERVRIITGIIDFTPKSLLMEYQMWNDEKTQLKALLWTRFLHIDLQHKKSCDHPGEIAEMLEKLLIRISETNIDVRGKALSK